MRYFYRLTEDVSNIIKTHKDMNNIYLNSLVPINTASFVLYCLITYYLFSLKQKNIASWLMSFQFLFHTAFLLRHLIAYSHVDPDFAIYPGVAYALVFIANFFVVPLAYVFIKNVHPRESRIMIPACAVLALWATVQYCATIIGTKPYFNYKLGAYLFSFPPYLNMPSVFLIIWPIIVFSRKVFCFEQTQKNPFMMFFCASSKKARACRSFALFYMLYFAIGMLGVLTVVGGIIDFRFYPTVFLPMSSLSALLIAITFVNHSQLPTTFMMKIVSISLTTILIAIGAQANLSVLAKLQDYESQRLQEIKSFQTFLKYPKKDFSAEVKHVSGSAQYIVEKTYGSPAIAYRTIWALSSEFDPAMLTRSDQTAFEKQAIGNLKSLRKNIEFKNATDSEILTSARIDFAGQPQKLLCRLQREGDAMNPETYFSYYNFVCNNKIYEVGYLYSHFRSYLNAEAMLMVVWIISTALIIQLFLPFVFRSNLRVPLNHLLEGVKKVNAGDLNVVVPVKTDDEIGFIARSFNLMVGSIKDTDAKLRDYADNLEGRVKEETEKQLAQARQLETKAKDFQKVKEQMENLIETSMDPILITDGEGLITKPNRAFKKMLGYAEEEILSKTTRDLYVSEEGTYESTTGEIIDIGEDYFQGNLAKVEQLFEEGKVSNWTSWYINSEGKIIPIIQSGVFLYNDEGVRITSMSIIHDITEQRKAEQAVHKAMVIAEEANRSKGNFLANMSHEIRTPMNGVIGFTDMLLDTGLNTEQEDYANTIKRSGTSLLSLINDILDFSKIEAGKIDFEEIDFDIEVLAYDVCKLIRLRTEQEVEILCRIDDELPARVKGDPYRFKQVLVNLMGNAAKFTNMGEIELTLAAEDMQDGRIRVHAKIRDTGIGIPQDKIDTIFEVFQQADDTTTRKYGGTGLGLSICRRIANIMSGNVWAESEEGQGSTFHFTVLLKQQEKNNVRRFSPISLNAKSVLIADDNRTNLEILKHILEAAGMRVSDFSEGEEALKATLDAFKANSPFDICILDVMMPGMSGYQLAKSIRSSVGDSIPIIAFSSTMEKGGARESQEAGCNGFLPKPIDRIKLLKMMERLLDEASTIEHKEKAETKLITQHTMQEDAKHAISILLAEDNPVNQKLATKLLTKAGYGIDVANDGKIAVDMLTANPKKFDIILMDIQMPELNGLDATRLLRDKGFTQIPIVAMTANAMKGDREKCLEAGMNDYIAKPIKREVVFEMLRKWVIEKVS